MTPLSLVHAAFVLMCATPWPRMTKTLFFFLYLSLSLCLSLIVLCLRKTAGFLRRMQNYMLPSHRKLMETVASRPSLRSLVLSRSDRSLCQAYNSCVSALVALRSYHLNVVAKYITVPGHRAQAAGCPFRGACVALGDRGTGGSSPMTLLKSVRDSTRKALIPQHMSLAEA